MICKIADLFVEVPEAGGMAPRCRAYLTEAKENADIVIRKEKYEPELYPELSYNDMCYMESGACFYSGLLNFGGMMLHASGLEYGGKAYLFSGPSTVGKSTHTGLWQQLLGDAVRIFNDDKPALRRIDDVWYAYGTPWCGKDGINRNMRAPLAGICFLKQGKENSIRKLSPQEAAGYILSQTINRFTKAERLDQMLALVDALVRKIPVYQLENLPGEAAARLSIETLTGSACVHEKYRDRP